MTYRMSTRDKMRKPDKISFISNNLRLECTVVQIRNTLRDKIQGFSYQEVVLKIYHRAVKTTMRHFQKIFMVCMMILHCVSAGFPDRPQYRNLYRKISKDLLSRYNEKPKRGPSEEQFYIWGGTRELRTTDRVLPGF